MAKRIFVLIGICLGIAMAGVVFSAVNTALATIQKELSTSVTQLQWIMNIFGVSISSSLVIFGRLADIYGRKRLYLIGILLLAIAMLGSGVALNANWIIFFQAITGIACAVILPVSQALISNTFAENERGKAIGIWAAAAGLALAAGPLISGLVIATLGWRWVFLLSIPIILISLTLVAIFSPESRSEETQPKLDWPGAILLAITISTFVLAVVQSGSWKPSLIVTLYTVAFIALIFLLFVEKKAVTPIIREDLFTNRMFLTASLGNFCLIFFVWASFFLIPLYLQTIHHYQVFQTGLIMLFVTIPLTFFSFAGGYFYKKFTAKSLISVGFIFLIFSALIQMYFRPDTLLFILIMGTLSFGIGWGLIWGPTTTTAISELPLQHAGIASGTFVTIQEIGGTVGLAITGSVVRAHPNLLIGYQDGMWVLVLISILGLIATLLMKRHRI